MKVTATIKRDHLTGEYSGRVLTWGGGVDPADGPEQGVVTERFALYDDDGELYYTGALQHYNVADAWDLLWGWGAWDSGTTLLRINGEDVIG